MYAVQSLDYVPPAYLSAPFDFPRYIGLHRRASKANPAPVIVAGLRDSADVSDIIGNTDQYVACRSFRGVNKVSGRGRDLVVVVPHASIFAAMHIESES